MAYTPRHPARSEFIQLRHTGYHLLHWGDPALPKLFLLHGWMDVAASFQFLVDALPQQWHVIAPDWRGFGQSQWNRESYYFPDYLADLDALLDLYQPEDAARLVGHSLGGIVACLYAGIRPERVEKLISIEGFGLAATQPEQAPDRLRRWLDENRQPHGFHTHSGLDAIAARLIKANPRLSTDKAAFLAPWVAEVGDAGAKYRSDPRHKMVNPILYRLEEAKAIWRRIEAATLWVRSDAAWLDGMLKEDPQRFAERKACFARLEETAIADCGHMLHHEQPERLAQVVAEFIQRRPQPDR